MYKALEDIRHDAEHSYECQEWPFQVVKAPAPEWCDSPGWIIEAGGVFATSDYNPGPFDTEDEALDEAHRIEDDLRDINADAIHAAGQNEIDWTLGIDSEHIDPDTLTRARSILAIRYERLTQEIDQ